MDKEKESLLVLSFPSEKARNAFLSQLCDGGIEDAISTSMEAEGMDISLDYKRAFKEWGWDGNGDPIVDFVLNT